LFVFIMFDKAYKLRHKYLSHAVQFITCSNDTKSHKCVLLSFYLRTLHAFLCIASGLFLFYSEIDVDKPHPFKHKVLLVLLVKIKNWRGQKPTLLLTVSGNLIRELQKPYIFVLAVTEAYTHTHTHTHTHTTYNMYEQPRKQIRL
jgi:hypothetical protein